jgi:hypothetical protein
MSKTARTSSEHDPSLLSDHIDNRLSGGKSGYDPIANRNEAAYAQGRFLRGLFTGQARTRNPFALLMMLGFGVLLLLPLVGLLDTGNVIGLRPADGSGPSPILVIVAAIIGGLLVYNAVMSIRRR